MQPHGGLIASGWHIASVCHRKMVDALAAEERAARWRSARSPASPVLARRQPHGLHRPGAPGRHGHLHPAGQRKRPSNSLPGWGILTNQLDGVNQRGETVYTGELIGFSKLRDYQMPLRLRLLMALTKLPGLGKLLAKRN